MKTPDHYVLSKAEYAKKLVAEQRPDREIQAILRRYYGAGIGTGRLAEYRRELGLVPGSEEERLRRKHLEDEKKDKKVEIIRRALLDGKSKNSARLDVIKELGEGCGWPTLRRVEKELEEERKLCYEPPQRGYDSTASAVQDVEDDVSEEAEYEEIASNERSVPCDSAYDDAFLNDLENSEREFLNLMKSLIADSRSDNLKSIFVTAEDAININVEYCFGAKDKPA